MRPLSCNYYLSFKCNDTCQFSDIWQRQDLINMQESSAENVKKNLQDLRKLGVLLMNFTGGEPLMRDDIGDILRFSKRLGFFNVLTTNGLLYEEKAQQVTQFVDHLLFSLDFPTEQEHNESRGINCFASVMDGIRASKKLGKNPIINFTVTRESILQMPEMVDLAEKMGVLLWINPVYNWFGLEGFSGESIEYLKRYAGRKNVALNFASLALMKRGGNNIARPDCRAGDSTVTILPDNSLVSPCFYLQKSKVLINKDLLNALKGREVKLSTSFHGRDEVCKGCMAWPYLNPSFLHGINRNLYQSLRSILSLFWKEMNLKKGARS